MFYYIRKGFNNLIQGLNTRTTEIPQYARILYCLKVHNAHFKKYSVSFRIWEIFTNCVTQYVSADLKNSLSSDTLCFYHFYFADTD